MDWNAVVHAILFALFASLTGVLAAILGPTYDGLLVPSLQPGTLFPSVGLGAGPAGFLTVAGQFSSAILTWVVDPAVATVALAIGLLYLLRSGVGRLRAQLDLLLPRLVGAVILANFTLPVCGALLASAGALYPLLASLDGGAWQHWINIGGWAEVSWSWDNGVLAFVVTFLLFSLVMILVTVVQVRNALLAVLLVVLPIFTLLGAIGPLSVLARRGWWLFVEMAFLPCVLVVPLELAVGAPSPVVALAYLAVAIGSPYLISLAGAHLGALGFAGAGGAVSGGIQRGLAVSALGLESYGRALSPTGVGLASKAVREVGNAFRTVGRSPMPAGLALLAPEGLARAVPGIIHRVAPAISRLRHRNTFPALPSERKGT